LEKDIDEQCYLNGNPNELSQVLINVINNARQAILKSNPTDPLIKIQLYCKEKNILIRIYNTGDLLSEDHASRIFEPYFTTREKDGTGLGLHICRQIIENKYRGSIIAENHSDGVEFIIKLPVNDNH